MYQMTEEERAERVRVKTLHKEIRSLIGDRYGNLAWGFIRGFKYRRIERSHHLQSIPAGCYGTITPYYILTSSEGTFFEHNMPSEFLLTRLLQRFVPETTKEQTLSWLSDRSGAIPIPLPKPKKPYVAALPEAG